jgi:hypothetical protein
MSENGDRQAPRCRWNVVQTWVSLENTVVALNARISYGELQSQEIKEQYHVEISNRFAASENLDTEVAIKRAWETSKEIIKISAKESLGYYELKKHKP